MADSVGEEMEKKHKELVLDMFEKITDYLNGELAGECMVWGVSHSVVSLRSHTLSLGERVGYFAMERFVLAPHTNWGVLGLK
jgi:hypothetical protein